MKDFNKIDTKQLCSLIEEYASTWGSLSKKEFEARLFNILIESKVVTSNIYDIMSKLCVTRQKQEIFYTNIMCESIVVVIISRAFW